MEISVNRSPDPAADAALARARNRPAQTQDAQRERQRQLREQARREVATGETMGSENEPEADTAEPRERLAAVEIELPSGQVVEFGPPSGVTVAAKLLTFFGGRDPSKAEETITTTMLYIKAIDGSPIEVRDTIQRDKLLNQIGDDGLLILNYARSQYWPGPLVSDLKIVKKTLR